MGSKIVNFHDILDQKGIDEAHRIAREVDGLFDLKKPLEAIASFLIGDIRIFAEKTIKGRLVSTAIPIPSFESDGSVKIDMILNTTDVANQSYLTIKLNFVEEPSSIPDKKTPQQLVPIIESLYTGTHTYSIVENLKDLSKIPVVAFSAKYNGVVTETKKHETGWEISMLSKHPTPGRCVALSIILNDAPLKILDSGISKRHAERIN